MRKEPQINADERRYTMPKDAIVIHNVSKTFRIPHDRKTTLFEHLSGLFDGKKGYEEFQALKTINFTVKKGEAIGIIGENGSGKSTLLKIIANILRPTSGSARINGKITSFLELGVGFEPNLTARENIYLYGTVMGLSDREIDERLEDILEFSGLKRFEDTKLKNLSSGMQVRLAFSTAIQTDPEILLMDEVLAVGDMEFQQKCLDVFQRYIKEKKTIVFVSHDMNSVRRFCNRVILLRGGEQVAIGKTNEIIDKYVYGAREPKKEEPKKEKNEEKKTEEKKKTRWGNKKIEITNVKFIDKFGNENKIFQTGDSITVRIFYKVNEYCENPVFGFAIYSDKDICCYGTNTDLQNYKIDKLKDEGYIDLIFEKIVMMQGRYIITIVVHSVTHEPYDWLDRQFSFNVINKTNEIGLFVLPCSWSMS